MGGTSHRFARAAQSLYPDFAPLVSLKARSYFSDGDLDQLPANVKTTLADAAASVRTIEAVPVLSPQLT